MAATEPGPAGSEPWYRPVADECEVFERAWRQEVPLLLKGPTSRDLPQPVGPFSSSGTSCRQARSNTSHSSA
ncbi:MAG: hypothetical protein ACQGVC_19200, partial [Myxococcota bacterium]